MENKSSLKKYIKWFLLSLAALIAIGFEFYQIFVWKTTNEYTYELGQTVSEDINDYLNGQEWRLAKAEVDISNVNQKVIGDYTAKVYLGKKVFEYPIHIIDTTAPDLLINSSLYMAKGREYSSDYVVGLTYDLSGEVTTGFIVDGVEHDSIMLEQLGGQNISVYAKDSSGNRNIVKVNVTVDTAPQYLAAWDLFILRGSKFEEDDYLGQVIALDDVDGNLTDYISVDYSQVNLGAAGNYSVRYNVSDHYGLESDCQVIAHVIEDRQEYDTAISNYNSKKNLTSIEKDMLFKADYYSYQTLEEEDIELAQQIVYPSLLNLSYTLSNGEGFGSGVICKIDKDYIYGLSVNHVIKMCSSNCIITFADGYSITTPLSFVVDNNDNELVLFRFATSNLPDSELINIKQIAYDTDIYNEIYANQEVFGYSANWNRSKDVIKTGTISNVSCSSHMSIANNCVETIGTNFINGMSGTALCDEKGNLLGLVSNSHWESGAGTWDYSVRYDNIEDMFERMDSLTQQ